MEGLPGIAFFFVNANGQSSFLHLGMSPVAPIIPLQCIHSCITSSRLSPFLCLLSTDPPAPVDPYPRTQLPKPVRLAQIPYADIPAFYSIFDGHQSVFHGLNSLSLDIARSLFVVEPSPSLQGIPFDQKRELLKPIIERLYIREDQTLPNVIEAIRLQHGFDAA